MPSSPGRNRRTLLVNRPYQIRVLLKILIVVIIATLSSTAAVYFLTGREIERSFYVIHRGISDMRALLLPVLVISAAATLLAYAALLLVVQFMNVSRLKVQAIAPESLLLLAYFSGMVFAAHAASGLAPKLLLAAAHGGLVFYLIRRKKNAQPLGQTAA